MASAHPHEDSETVCDKDRDEKPRGTGPLADRTNLAGLALAVTAAGWNIVFLWERSHLLSVWAAWLALVIVAYWLVRDSGHFSGILIVLTVSAVTVAFLLPARVTAPPDWLIPESNLAKQDDFVVQLGPTGMHFVVGRSDRPFPIISAKGQPLLWARTVDGALALSGRFFDEDGIVAKLIDNRPSGGNALAVDRPTPHTLVVRDRWDRPIARVDYLDPRTIQVVGHFSYGSGHILVADERGVALEHPKSGQRELIGSGVELSGASVTAGPYTIGW